MKLLRKYTLLTGSLLALLLPKSVAFACGFYVAPGEYRFWLLQPDLTNQRELTPFFFASTYLYKGDQYAVREASVDQNIKEWHREVKGQASLDDIDTVLNHLEPQVYFESLPSLAKDNSFLSYLLRRGNKELYRYMWLSKKVEQIAANPDPWEEEVFPSAVISAVIEELKRLRWETTSPFLKLRTAYQLERLYGYNRQFDLVRQTYDSLIAPVPADSWVKTAALYQKAITAPGFESDYLLSKVFDKGGYNRVSCLVRFRSSALDSILPYAQNAHERTVLYAMKVFNYPGRSLRDIERIYRAAPAYKEIPFLLLREINKVEDWLLTNKVTAFAPAVANGRFWGGYDYNKAVNYHQDLQYAEQVYHFVRQVVREGKNRSGALLNLYAAHLALLQGDYAASSLHLAAAKKVKGVPANVRTQIRINELLLALHLEKGFSKETENMLMALIQAPASQLALNDPGIMKDQLILFAARNLLRKGEKVKGYMLLSKTRRAIGELPIWTYKTVWQELEETATPADYDGIIAVLDKKAKTPFESFVSQGPFGSSTQYYEYLRDYYEEGDYRQWDRHKLLDGKATWYLRRHNLSAALQTLRQIPDSFWKREPYVTYIGGNPFYLNVYHAHRIFPEEGMNCNKREVVEKMVQLQRLALKDPQQAAECYYLLGNAWYNMTHHGKNWLMVKQWWARGEFMHYNDELERTPFHDVYFGSTRARAYYLKALKETKDKKLARLALFMAGACERNYQEYLWIVKNKGTYNAAFKASANPYVKVLKQKGLEVDYYRQIIRECDVYNESIRQYNRML
jgi:hypothetical protein